MEIQNRLKKPQRCSLKDTYRFTQRWCDPTRVLRVAGGGGHESAWFGWAYTQKDKTRLLESFPFQFLVFFSWSWCCPYDAALLDPNIWSRKRQINISVLCPFKSISPTNHIKHVKSLKISYRTSGQQIKNTPSDVKQNKIHCFYTLIWLLFILHRHLPYAHSPRHSIRVICVLTWYDMPYFYDNPCSGLYQNQQQNKGTLRRSSFRFRSRSS